MSDTCTLLCYNHDKQELLSLKTIFHKERVTFCQIQENLVLDFNT